jgi:hypothetical protein
MGSTFRYSPKGRCYPKKESCFQKKEDERSKRKRDHYAKGVLKKLADQLTLEFGKGYQNSLEFGSSCTTPNLNPSNSRGLKMTQDHGTAGICSFNSTLFL